MDVRTALKNTVSFPLSAGQVEVIAVERGLDLDAQFTRQMGLSMVFQLAKADMIRCIVTAPNVTEGGVSISVADRKTLIGIANGIYARFEPESLLQEAIPTVTPIYD